MKIIVTSPSFSKNKILRNELTQLFPECKLNINGIRLADNDLYEFIEDADGIIVGLEKINKEFIDKMPDLKIISKYGVGLDNIDVEYCKEKKITIGWTPGTNKLSVAEMTLSFMIMLSRNLYVTSNQLKSGHWNKDGGFNLSDKIVGIIGIGNIGKEVIRLLKPFNCEIMVNDIIDQIEYYKNISLIESSKIDIFKNADFITIHTPLTTKTENLINIDTFSIMKKNAFLINTARGGIVNQDDLKQALINNMIAGCALDTYEEEPPTDIDMLQLPNLICTPHIGGNSYESVLSMGRSAIKHLKEFFKK